MRRRRRQRGLLGPVAISIAAHGALLWALVRWAPPPARGEADGMIVLLRPGAREAPAAPLPPGRLEGEATRRAPPRAGRPGQGAGPGAGPYTRDDVTRWLSGDDAAPRLERGDLAPRLPGTPPPEFGAPPPSPAKQLQDRVATVMGALRAQDLAQYPDASWTELRDALGDGFVPPERALDLAKAGGAGGSGAGALGRWLGGYGDAAERYGRTGSPIAPGPDAPGARAQSTRAAQRNVAAAGAMNHPERAALAQAVDALDAQPGPSGPTEHLGGLVAIVAVRLDDQGAVKSVRLVARSASADYDRAALAQAERLAGRELSRRLAGTETEWAFVTEVRVRPLAPAAALQFDATFKPSGFAHPLQRVTRTRVELRAVHGG